MKNITNSTIGEFEKDYKIPSGTIRHTSGRKVREDKHHTDPFRTIVKPVRAVRSDCTVGIFEKTRGLEPGSLRHQNGRKIRKDKLMRTIRKESGMKI